MLLVARLIEEKNPASYPIGVKNVVRFLVSFLHFLWWSYCNGREENLVFSICSIFNLGVRQFAQKLSLKTDLSIKSYWRLLILCGGTSLKMPSRLTVLLVLRIPSSSTLFTMCRDKDLIFVYHVSILLHSSTHGSWPVNFMCHFFFVLHFPSYNPIFFLITRLKIGALFQPF